MAQFIGLATIGRDVVLREHNGDPVANLALAFNYGRKGENNRRPSTWVDAALWGKRAEALAPYLLKGSRVVVTVDDLHMEPYTSAGGAGGVKLVGSISNIELAGDAKRDDGGYAERAAAPPPARAAAPRPAPAARQAPARMPDDDIPF